MRPNATVTTDIVRLVLGVARLGEKDLRGWWRGHTYHRFATRFRVSAALGQEPEVELFLA